MRTALASISGNAKPREAAAKDAPRRDVNEDEYKKSAALVESISSQLSDSKSYSFQRILKSNLQDRSTKRKRESSVEYGIESSPTRAQIVAKSTSPLDLNWDLLKRWPEGIAKEEEAMTEYFRKLKRFHIEQETKQLFMAYTNDGARYHLYTAEEVKEMEKEVYTLKMTLKNRKRHARDVRNQIESLCDELNEIEALKAGVEEAEELKSSVKDLEHELERLRASRARKSGGRKSSDGGLDKKAMNQEQALQMLNEQLEAMQNLEDEHAETLRSTDAVKKRLADGMQRLNRLQADHKAAESQLALAKSQKKDVKAEKAYKSYSATLDILKSLIGIISVEAPTPTALRCVYKVQDDKAQSFCSEVAVLLHFVSPGGRIERYEMQSLAGQSLTDRFAPLESPQRMHLDLAVKANDASLLLQEILLCIEAVRPDRSGV